jgi:hypothetical protein
MKQVAYYEAFDHYGTWYGTATLAAIKKAGLIPDLASLAYGRPRADGWGCRAKR